MKPPERVFVTMTKDHLVDAFGHRVDTSYGVECHEYRLVRPKREPLYWVCRTDTGTYATAYGSGSDDRRMAARFLNEDSAERWRKSAAPYYEPRPVYAKRKDGGK